MIKCQNIEENKIQNFSFIYQLTIGPPSFWDITVFSQFHIFTKDAVYSRIQGVP